MDCTVVEQYIDFSDDETSSKKKLLVDKNKFLKVVNCGNYMI